MSINEVEFRNAFNLKDIDQGFERYVDQDDFVILFGEVDKVVVGLDSESL